MSESISCLEGLELQIAEAEMLQSMYPNHGEFTLDDPVALQVARSVISGELDIGSMETRIGFTLQVACSNAGKKVSVELVCQLPHEYPFVKPQIFTRSPDLSKDRHQALREELNKQLEGIEDGELVVGTLVEWLQDRLYTELSYVDTSAQSKKGGASQKVPRQGRATVTRLWVYSHHIYSKIKRKDLQDWGRELSLHGFSMPGKPGVICAEGYTCDVDEFWYRVRRLNWKKICIKEQEICPILESDELASVCKFDAFAELILDARGGKGREYHMDLGQFHSYLHNHDSGHIFGLYFGLDGKQHVGD